MNFISFVEIILVQILVVVAFKYLSIENLKLHHFILPILLYALNIDEFIIQKRAQDFKLVR